MKIKVDFSGIEASLLAIGGVKADIGQLRNPRQIQNPKQIRNPIELKIIEKGSVVLSGAELAENLLTRAGLLSIGETQITIHISEPYETEESLSEKPARKTRFHVSECKTIEDMRVNGRDKRYVPSMRQDGLFEVRPCINLNFNDLQTVTRGEKMEAFLQPCQNCLAALNYEKYNEKTKAGQFEVIRKFELKNFFEDFESIFRCLPIYTSGTFPEGDYSDDWARKSWETRNASGWVCSCCGINCSDNTGLLHVHHKDGNRGNVRPSNLEVVCVACHKARPFHGAMTYPPNIKMKLENLRLSQKLPRTCSKCKI